jgi:hypothetical protein
VRDYAGARLVTPGDVEELKSALLELPEQRHTRFDDPHSWANTVAAHERLAAELATR